MKLMLSSARRDGVLVLSVTGEVDVYTAGQLRSALENHIASGETSIVVDLREVGFLDSTGLGVLVGRLRHIRQIGGWLRVVCTDERIARLFGITGLDQVLPIDESVDDAIAAGPAPAEPFQGPRPLPNLGPPSAAPSAPAAAKSPARTSTRSTSRSDAARDDGDTPARTKK